MLNLIACVGAAFVVGFSFFSPNGSRFWGWVNLIMGVLNFYIVVQHLK